MAAQLTFVLTPVQPSAVSSQQLSSQGGLQMSQVCTICIDNSLNGTAISVTHGVFNETSIVPAFGAVILPTFSTRGGAYTMLIAPVLAPAARLNSDLTVEIILMNYPRSPGSFGNMVVSSILGANQNIVPISVGTTAIDLSGHVVVILAAQDNYILSNIDVYCQSIGPAAAGVVEIDWSIMSSDTVTNTFGPGQTKVVAGAENFTASNTNVVAGPQFTVPTQINFGQGLLLPRDRFLLLSTQGGVNVAPLPGGSGAEFRVQIYGVTVP